MPVAFNLREILRLWLLVQVYYSLGHKRGIKLGQPDFDQKCMVLLTTVIYGLHLERGVHQGTL